MNAHANLDDAMADAIEAELNNVVPFLVREPVSVPETELENIANIHRNGVAHREQRIAATRKAGKAKVADLKAELARITAEIAATEAKAKRDIAADKKVIAASRAALEMLEAEG